MPLETARHYPFLHGAIQANAPRGSGVYVIFRGEEWLYMGEADNVYAGLLNYFDHTTGRQAMGLPTAFAFETCEPEKRGARLVQLIFKCHPTYASRPELMLRET